MLKQQNDKLVAEQQAEAGSAIQSDSLEKSLKQISQLIDTGANDSGIELVKKVLAQFPEQGELLHRYAQLLVGQGKLDEARSLLELALQYKSDCAAAHNDLGIIQSELGNNDLAAHYLARAYELEPDNMLYIENMADLNITLGRVGEALQLYEKALILDTRNLDLLIKLASIFIELQKSDEAKILVDKIIEIDPNNLRGRELQNHLSNPSAVS